MKDLVRLRTSLKEEIEIVLNAQIKMEFEASQKYLAIASWLERNGYENTAAYMYRQSDEERAHGLKIFRYINEIGGTAITPTVADVPQEFASFRNVFEIALQNEIAVTLSLSKVVAKCRQNDDYTTEGFMMWFMNEQREEERNARRALELFDLIEDNGAGKFLLDQEIAKISPAIA